MTFTPNKQVVTDEALLNILKGALDGELRKKQAQVADPTMGIVKKLVNKLQREFSGKPPQSNISTDIPDAEAVTPTHLGTIDKLIQYLAKNKIKADGQQIAFSAAEYATLPDDAKKTLGKFSAKLARDAATLKWDDDDFWINVPALSKYIGYLQQKADTMQRIQNNPEGRILQVQVNKLIDELNGRINPNSGLSKKQKGTPEKPAELPGDTPLDSFSDKKVLDPKNPNADTGSVQLFAKNLSSKAALNDWLLGGGEWGGPATIIMYDQKGRRGVSYTDDSADQCVMVNALYQRAAAKQSRARNPEEEKRFSYYLNKIKELGGAFNGPDGKACTIAGAHPSATPGTPALPGGGVTEAVLQHVVQALPLDPNDIDFHRIKAFFNMYRQILANSQSPRRGEVENAMSQAEQYMDTVSKMTKGGDQTFNLAGDPGSFVNMLNGPPIQMYNSLMQNLQFIVERTGAVIGAFYAQYVRAGYGEDVRTIFNDNQRATVEAQILGSNSYLMRNKSRLQMLMQGGPQFVR